MCGGRSEERGAGEIDSERDDQQSKTKANTEVWLILVPLRKVSLLTTCTERYELEHMKAERERARGLRAINGDRSRRETRPRPSLVR